MTIPSDRLTSFFAPVMKAKLVVLVGYFVFVSCWTSYAIGGEFTDRYSTEEYLD